ncbi:unnamed protein product [Ixodes persulcatus]
MKRRGLDLEGPAKESFLEENQSHTNITLHDCGLFLSDEFAFIGASPDAFIKCECCGVRILEIRAPEVIETFSKKELKNGTLKQTSNFFAQLQMQMGVAKVPSSVLLIYSDVSKSEQVPVAFDGIYFADLVSRLQIFTNKFLIPEIIQEL